MSFRNFVILLFATLHFGVVKAQSISSPYSNYGLGEVSFSGLPHNYGMGETGFAMPSLWHINLQNPSLLINNSLSSFQVGLMADVRSYESDAGSASETTGSLRFLAMSYPVVKSRWTTSFALLPLSSVNYNTFSRDSVNGSLAGTTRFAGDGGLTQFVWANGVRIYKSFALGLKAAYVFGLIDRESQIFLSGSEIATTSSISYLESTSYSDFLFSLSASYKLKLADRKYLNFGGVYDLSEKLNGKQDVFFRRLSLSGVPIQVQEIARDKDASFNLARSYGFGISYETLNKLKVGADIALESWEESEQEESTITYRNTLKIAAGTAWTPDVQSVNNYFDRVTYRMGFTIKQSPYLINNTEINDFGINFGASFPVSGYSSMDAAFKFGQRGTTDSNLIRENYFQIIVGATINDQWFVKRRYD